MLHKIALAKSDKLEEDYRTRYIKLKLSKAEAEKKHLFQGMKSQESSRSLHGNDTNDSLQMFANALKNQYVYFQNINLSLGLRNPRKYTPIMLDNAQVATTSSSMFSLVYKKTTNMLLHINLQPHDQFSSFTPQISSMVLAVGLSRAN